MAVITAEDFRAKAVKVIRITGFEPGETIEIKVKKLGLVGLMSSGKIPNSLMANVQQLFSGMNDGNITSNEDALGKADEIGKLLDIVCKEAMMEPKFEDVADVMSDEQKMDIFQFTQTGIEIIKPFSAVEKDTGRIDDVKAIPMSSELNNGN